jgi:pyruvate dehydrogenase complex dehydrogenase (E1) component
MGDGEMDEPESMGAIAMAARENLDNLIFVVNCNLQRLDGRCAATARSSRSSNRISAAPAGT